MNAIAGEISGDIFEHAVVLSVKTEDQDAFERDFFQLKPYYTDTRYVASIIFAYLFYFIAKIKDIDEKVLFSMLMERVVQN